MYEKSAKGWLKHCDFMILDIGCLELSFLLSYFLRQGFSSSLEGVVYRSMFFILAFVQVFVVLFFDTFRGVLKRGVYLEFIATVKHTVLVAALCAFVLFITKMSDTYSRVILILTTVLYTVSSYIIRILWKRKLEKRAKNGEGSRSLLIVSSKMDLNHVVNHITRNNYAGYRIVGIVVVDAQWKGSVIQGIPVVADASDMAEYACREWVDEVFISLPIDDPHTEEIRSQFLTMGITVHLALADAQNLSDRNQSIEKIGTYMVISSSINMATKRQMFLKRCMDICAGLAGSLVTLALTVCIGPLIYFKSPGPIFFSQIRVGRNGKKFKMYKFRSMYRDAEERKAELMSQNRVAGGMMFKLDHDPRIIGSEKGQGKGIGNFIRKTSLDEFPQFWNVLKGEMSLVGTRPPTVDEWEKYDLHHRARLAAKPGITGMWQVSGRSDITDFEEVVRLDTSYIEQWSIGMDLRILLKTVQAVLNKKGSM